MVPANLFEFFETESNPKALKFEKYSPLEILDGYPIASFELKTPD